MKNATARRRAGFTLIELLIVIAIIGLLVSLILVAANDGVRRAEERATQSLITKLETAINDRLDAVLNAQPPVNQTHRFLAAINFQNSGGAYVPIGSGTSNSDDRRAQVIAQFDFLRGEFPDVFFLNSQTSDGASLAGSYPLNFAAAPYPAGTNSATNFVLPLGNTFPGLPLDPATGSTAITFPALPSTGMFGASFSAAGGIYKNLGYSTKGYDGIDNDGNGLIDDLPEGVPAGMTTATFQAQVAALLAKHTHKTARSEMLYAILVEGLSPLGSVFNAEDFTNNEIKDTDGDGLPEFVDAWGEPLQFFRWPVYYGGLPRSLQPNPTPLGTSDSQLGSRQYDNPAQAREQDPLDPNQLLVSPGWWASAANPSMTFAQTTFAPPNGNSTSQSSPGAIGFMNYFHSLVDPYPTSTGGVGWDRGGNFPRREYFTKVLILSGGPDHEPGVAQFAKDYSALVDTSPALTSPYQYTFPDSTKKMEANALALIYIENQASVSNPLARSGSFFETPDASVSSTTVYLSKTANSDDITNHNISGISTGVR